MLNLLVVVDFRFISAFLYVHWAVNSHVRRLLNFYHLRFPEFDWSFKDFQSDQMQSTLALWTPRFLGHPAFADMCHPPPPPGEMYKEMTETNSHYYGNADTFLPPSVTFL